VFPSPRARDEVLAGPYVTDHEGLERMFAGETHSDDDFRELIRQIMPLYNVVKDPQRDAESPRLYRRSLFLGGWFQWVGVSGIHLSSGSGL